MRLIDADALMAEFEKAERAMEQHGQEYACSFLSSSQELSTEWYCVEDILENAPTIELKEIIEELEEYLHDADKCISEDEEYIRGWKSALLVAIELVAAKEKAR